MGNSKIVNIGIKSVLLLRSSCIIINVEVNKKKMRNYILLVAIHVPGQLVFNLRYDARVEVLQQSTILEDKPLLGLPLDFLHTKVDRFTNKHLSTTIETIGFTLACPVSNLSPVFGPSIKRNKRSNHLATRETASYILFSAKTQIYKQNTYRNWS